MPKGDKKRKHKHSQTFYARVYGCTRDQVGRMVREGINPEDPAAVQVFLTTRTRGIVSRGTERPTRETLVSAPQSPNNENHNGDSDLSQLFGLPEVIKELQKAAFVASKHLKTALESKNFEAIRFWREELVNLAEQSRKIEAVNPEIEREKRESVRTSDVKIFMNRMLSSFRAAIDAAPERIAHKLVGLDVPAILEELKKENEIILRNLETWKPVCFEGKARKGAFVQSI